ncbi:peptidoglycan DD-metalloendopeptidase family protein [Streptomyces sp. NPDC057217]|uniref:peptidoglycan DD-metalloendopeptidase family protein n=1 Tax=Streptomyces sp. NPDC057217 TaxID=3346054 RepID=UPI0036344FA4
MAGDLDIVGSAGVDVVPVAPTFHAKLKEMVLRSADRVGEEAGRKLGDALADAMMRQVAPALPRAVQAGGRAATRAASRQGTDAGGAFARSLKTKLEAAFRAMPRLNISATDTGVDAQLARIRAKLEQLSNKRIGIDISAEDAAARVEALEEQLRRLGAAHPNVTVRADTAVAREALREVREQIAEISAVPGRVRLETDGSFGARLRAVVEQARAALPEINIDADTSEAEAEIQGLRAQLDGLRDQRVGIDISAAEALATIERVQERLEVLSRSGATVDVRADTGAAAAELAAFQAQVEALDASDIDIKVSTTAARSALMSLGIQMAILMAIPLGPVLTASLGAVVSMTAAAGAGFGAFALAAIPAVKGVTEVLKAQKTAQDDAAQAATRGAAESARAAQQAASHALQMAGAQASLTAAHRNAARSIAQSNRAIEDAERNLADVGIRSADQRRQAAESIAQAQRSLAQAVTRAADQQRQAAESVERAERSLSDAKRSAVQAEEDLARAHREAAEELANQRREMEAQRRELAKRLEDSSLDERAGVLRVTEAQEELARVMSDPKATDLQRQRAQLALDEAEHGLKRQRERIQELRNEQAKQTRESVAGAKQSEAAQDKITSAEERLADAKRKVADEAKALVDAQRDAARDQVKAQEDIAEAQERVADAQRSASRVQLQIQRDLADAQRRVADAVENSANTQIAAAEAIASAERGVASARLSGASATSTAISKQQEYERALAKLTPVQRELYDSIAGPQGIKSAFKAWAEEMQPHILPLFTRGVDSAKASLPGLTPLVIGTANAIETLMNKASAQMKTPFWVSFKADLKENVEPAVVGFGVAFGNIIKGIAGIIDAFLPHMDGIASRSDKITERFANWGTSLKGSPDFERFLDYVKDTTPGLGKFLRELLTALLDVSKAMQPASAALFAVLTPLFEAISWLATNAPELVLALWGLWAAQKAVTLGMAAFAAAMFLYESVMILATIATAGWAVALNATGIVPIIRAIVLVIGLLVAAVIYAYNNWDWFRVTVDTVASAIGTAASWLWEKILKPTFEGIWWVIKKVGEAAVWLWDVAIGPTFRFLWEAGKVLFTILVVGVLTPIYLAFKALGEIGAWLWEEVLRPVFTWIGEKATALWNDHIKPHFGEMKKSFEILGNAAKWLWDNALNPIFTWIGDKAKKLYTDYIKPYLSEAKKTFEALGDAFKWVWDHILRPVLSWLGEKAKATWEDDLKPAFDLIGKGVDAVAKSFEDGKNSIKKAWDQLKEIAKKPVRFVIDKVYNNGIVPMWNKVAEFTGVGKLEPMDLKGFARGGVIPGQSSWRNGDTHLRPMREGEGVYVSEAMRDPYERARLFAVNRAAMNGQSLSNFQGGYAEGGIVGWLKDKADDLGNFLSNPLDVFSGVGRIVTEQMKEILTDPWARSVAKMPGKMLSGLKDKALSLLGLDSNGNATGGGAWVKPVDGAFGTPFGKAGSMWSSGRHTGLDFPAAIGTAVKAVAGGRVSATGSTGPYGIHLTVDHGGGLTSLYAHLSQLLTAAGAPVSAGQVIGRVGDTGNVTGPHLHLEARRNGRAVDPMPFFTSGGGGGGKGVERWRSTVLQALRITGNPASYADLTLRRMNQESGGNPNAVNNWDINAKNGMPSVGLMQVIRPTFDAYAGDMRNVGPKLHGVSTNPLANVFASMNYAKDRYGSLPTAYNRPGGYATGGFPAMGELAWVGEHGPELVRFLHPAQVYSHGESMAMAREATTVQAAPGHGSGSAPEIKAVHVYIGDRELTDIVDTRIEYADAQLVTTSTYGRNTYA